MGNKKTVAERLREHNGKDMYCIPDAYAIALTGAAVPCENTNCGECRSLWANKLADAIEAEQAERHHDVDVDVDALLKLAEDMEEYFAVPPYKMLLANPSTVSGWEKTIRNAVKGATFEQAKPQLPEGIEWPRFEDGELVKIGDKFKWEHEDGKAVTVTSLEFKKHEVIVAGSEGDTEFFSYTDYGETFKRPEPEVLDADGVPIEVGDTVWDRFRVRYTVRESPDSELSLVRLTNDNGLYALIDPNCLTHRKPDTYEDVLNDAEKFVKSLGDGRNATYVFTLLERQRKLMGGERA